MRGLNLFENELFSFSELQAIIHVDAKEFHFIFPACGHVSDYINSA